MKKCFPCADIFTVESRGDIEGLVLIIKHPVAFATCWLVVVCNGLVFG